MAQKTQKIKMEKFWSKIYRKDSEDYVGGHNIAASELVTTIYNNKNYIVGSTVILCRISKLFVIIIFI